MRHWAESTGGQPAWTTETRLKMAEIYHLLEERIEKENQCVLWGVCIVD